MSHGEVDYYSSEEEMSLQRNNSGWRFEPEWTEEELLERERVERETRKEKLKKEKARSSSIQSST